MEFTPYYYSTTVSSSLYEKSKEPPLLPIIVFVLIFHLIGGWFFSWSSIPLLKSDKPLAKVVVKTIKLHPMAPKADVAVVTPAPMIEKTLIPTPQPIVEVEPTVKTEVEKPVPETSKSIPVKEETPVEPVVIKEIPPIAKEIPKQAVPPAPSKVETKKAETKPTAAKVIAPSTKTPAKAHPSKETKKVAAPKPAPVKAAEQTKTPPKKPKEPSPEEIAAREAEKKRQQELEAAHAAAKAKQQELLAKAKENLAKAGEARSQVSTAAAKMISLDDTSIPQQLAQLQIDALPTGTGLNGELNAKEISYRDEIAYRLKMALRLPDYGQVTMKLILERSGKVAQIQIMKSQSNKNTAYIEKTVPTLLFPAFGNNFAQTSQYSFLITLNND